MDIYFIFIYLPDAKTVVLCSITQPPTAFHCHSSAECLINVIFNKITPMKYHRGDLLCYGLPGLLFVD